MLASGYSVGVQLSYLAIAILRAGYIPSLINTMDHTSEDYSYYEYVEAIEENNLTIIKDAPDIEEHDE